MELQKQESRPPKSSEEIGFLNAVLPAIIKKRPEEDLRQVLRYCMVKVGLRAANFPTGIEKNLLMAHIVENYGNHTPEEIRLAFDLALSAKLGLDISDIKCYESFSCLYFSTIMNAYRAWAVQVSRQNEGEIKIEEKVYSDQEKEQIDKDYQEFLKTPLAKQFGL